MESLNVKKIAAVTAGAVLIGATLLAAAPIMYGNTEIVNAQGKPVVKVVVGANAKASDGVAAANIAAVIGSMAYKSQTVSAQLTGSPSCNVTAGGSAGACSVSDKKVTLEITTPGTATVAGGYGFRTYGYGFVDNNGSTEDNQYTDGTAKKITGDNLAAFADFKTSVSSVSGSFTETQELYVSQTSTAAFDSDADKYYVQPENITYTLNIDHSTYNGVPYCVKESELTADTCTTDNLIERQRLKIKYLGEDWIVSGMDNGTSVSLAKESTPASIVYAGQNVSAGAYTVKLADLTIPYGAVDAMAVLQIFDANKQLVKEDTAASGATKEISLPNGDKVNIHIYKTAPGLTTAKWAEMAVYTQEITLTDGSNVDEDLNENWTVTLAWDTYGSAINGVLTDITLERTSFDDLFEGESVNMIESPAVYQYNFAGWTLTDAQRDNLKITWERLSNYYANESTTTTTAITDSGANRTFVCFTSDKKSFDVGSDMRSKFCYGQVANMTVYDKDGKNYFSTGNEGESASGVSYEINDDSSYDSVIATAAVGTDTMNVTVYENPVKGYTGADLAYFQVFADAGAKKFYRDSGSTEEGQVVVGYVSAHANSSSVVLSTANREPGFISQKGSVLATKSASTMTLKMAKKLGELQYYVKSAGSNVSAGTSVSTLSEGQQVTVQDSTVKVSSISQTVGACSVSGGESGCTADKGAMKAVLDVAGAPSSADFSMPYQFSATERLVVLDSEAPTAESLILVGGQLVNTVTQSTISGTDVKIDKPGVKVVKAVSDQRIVVAGYNAEDTTAAASQFISELLAKVA